MPRVSVILASYNHAQFAAEAVRSVLAQTLDDFELVVTDDGSSDGTADVVAGFDDPRIRLHRFPTNRGACSALNDCLSRATGEYVALLNSDDVYLPEKLARQVAALDADPAAGAVFTQASFIDGAGDCPDPASHPYGWIFGVVQPDRAAWLRLFFFRGNALNPSFMMRRDLLDSVGHFDTSLRQLYDFDLYLRIALRAELRMIEEPLLQYRVWGPGNTSGNTSGMTSAVMRRTAWEHARIRRLFWTLGDADLVAAFTADFPAGTEDRPPLFRLALAAAGQADPGCHWFALETVERMLQAGTPGIEPRDLHDLAGQLDPFRIIELLAAQNRIAALEADRALNLAAALPRPAPALTGC